MKLFEDMTQWEAAERALRDAQEFQSRLIACSQDCIKVLDLEGRLLWINDGGMQALEICDLGPLVNSSWLEFWNGDDAKAARDAVETARKGGTGRFTGYFATATTKQPRWWDVVVSPWLAPFARLGRQAGTLAGRLTRCHRTQAKRKGSA